jgi:biofilm PGA synthesis N-glycosyltransferase PgaC
LARLVGLVIAGAVTAAAALLWFAIASREPTVTWAPESGLVFGAWNVVYDTHIPTVRVLAAAAAIALLFAAGVALLERRITNQARRSDNAGVRPLAPKVIMAMTRGTYAGPVTVTVVIPAHDEEASIGATLESLLEQSHRPERVIVVADNCTDGTIEVARRLGAEVFETSGNSQKKAGALNQILAVLLPQQGHNDIVMMMDADTVLDAGFLEAGARRFTSDRALMAVGGIFYGETRRGFIAQLQRSEYVRYARELGRRRGRVFVLTGTATMFRPLALQTVAESRGVTIPGQRGDVYDTYALTEDNELTLALKSLGGLIISPAECRVVTELMPTWRHLWTQRLRWERGALENIGTYGMTPAILRYWAQQLGIGYSVVALSSFWFLMLITILAVDRWIWFPFWLGIGTIFIAERVITVWKGGWKARLLAMTLFPELAFDFFLDIVYVKGIFDITFGRRASWGHVEHGPSGELTGES